VSWRNPTELLPLHEAFLDRQPADRPLLGFWLGGYYPAEQFPHGTAGWKEGQALHPSDMRMEDFAEDYERLCQLHRQVEDDFFYVGSAYWGIPWMEAILGCPVFSGRQTAWAKPCIEQPEQIDTLSVDVGNNAWFRCLLSFTRDIVDFADGRFPVCPPLLRGPGDTACAVLGTTAFATGFIDDPQRTKRLLDICADARLEVVKRLDAVIPDWRGTHAAGGYPSKLWSRRTVSYNQEDCAALLSPRFFREFLLPQEKKMGQAADVNFIHLHSACLYPAETFLNDDTYDVIEINIDHKGTGPVLSDILPVFRRIQESGRPLLLWGDLEPEEWAHLRRTLSPVGLSLQPVVQNPSKLTPLSRVFAR